MSRALGRISGRISGRIPGRISEDLRANETWHLHDNRLIGSERHGAPDNQVAYEASIDQR